MGNIYAGQIQAQEVSLLSVDSSGTQGYSGLQLLGNVTKVCNDGLERARVALESIECFIPAKKIVVSIAPADIKKNGNQYDLPMAISVYHLLREGNTRLQNERWLFAAELSLNGELRPVSGIIPFVIAASQAKLNGIVVAQENLREIAVLQELNPNNIKIIGAKNLKQLKQWLENKTELHTPLTKTVPSKKSSINFDDMVLTSELRKAAIVTAVGKHNVLLRGVPGSGKSMWAQRVGSIMSPLKDYEHLESLKIHSIFSHNLSQDVLSGSPPLRAPHHQASCEAIIGNAEHPGEIALAHQGILFLDEVTEFRRDLLEALREPLESKSVNISRVERKTSWQSNILLIAACNNCPCGWFGSDIKPCRCAVPSLLGYQRKLSGPFLDRIDIHLNFSRPIANGLVFTNKPKNNQTQMMTEEVLKAQEFGVCRNFKFGVNFNSELKADNIFEASGMAEEKFRGLLSSQFHSLLSTRSQLRILRVARTLADLERREAISLADIQQAKYWHYEANTPLSGLPA